jgi:hypothetical protein
MTLLLAELSWRIDALPVLQPLILLDNFLLVQEDKKLSFEKPSLPLLTYLLTKELLRVDLIEGRGPKLVMEL